MKSTSLLPIANALRIRASLHRRSREVRRLAAFPRSHQASAQLLLNIFPFGSSDPNGPSPRLFPGDRGARVDRIAATV